MIPETDRQITVTEPWLQRANAQELSYNQAGKWLDEILQDCCSSSDAHSVIMAAAPTATACTTHEAFAHTARAPALLIKDPTGRRAGYTEFCAESVLVDDPEGRIVARRSTPKHGGWDHLTTRGALHQEVVPHHDF